MADEVKVKFGGDFSNLGKGADRAMKTVGTALRSAWKDVTQSVGGQIVAGLAAGALLTKWVDGVRDQLRYFTELNLAIKKVGGSSEEFQRLAGAAKSNGVGFEELARSLNKFNRSMANAGEGNKDLKDTLISLGYTEDDISKGTITATDVMGRLGDQFKMTGDQARLTDDVIKLFGGSGANLIPIFKEGTEALREFTKAAKVYSNQTIDELSKVDKAITKAEKKLKDIFITGPMVAYSKYIQEREYDHNVQKTLESGYQAGKGFSSDVRGKYAAQQMYGDVTTEYKSAEDLKQVIKRMKADQANMTEVNDRYGGEAFQEEGRIRLEAYKILIPQLERRAAMAAANESIADQNKRDADLKKDDVKPDTRKNGKNTLEGGVGDIGSPDGNVVGVGRNLQFSMMKEQLDVLKQINENMINLSAPALLENKPDFTKHQLPTYLG